MRKYLFLLVAIFALGSCALAAPKKTPVKKPLPVWKPAPALLKQLAPQSELPFGTIRLPRGYEHFDFPFAPVVGTALSWGKPAAKREDVQLFLVVQMPREEGGWQKLSLEATLNEYMKGFYQMYDNGRRTQAKQGLINGVRTLRSEWSGTFRPTRVKLQGTLFMMQDETDVYVIQTVYRVGRRTEQRLAEAAALTFKIQNQN